MIIQIDPVCGKRVDQSKAAVEALFSPYHDHLYYFFALACKRKFDENRAAHAIVTDVVCRREVEIGEAEGRTLYDDQETGRYYFCSEQCQAKFKLAPEFYSQLHAEDQHERQHRPGSDHAAS